MRGWNSRPDWHRDQEGMGMLLTSCESPGFGIRDMSISRSSCAGGTTRVQTPPTAHSSPEFVA